MIVANKIQKSIYNSLKKQDSDNFKKLVGIFNYINKNTEFPYIFYFIDEISNISTFSEEMYSYSIILNVFDKNTTNSFLVSISDEIESLFNNISNFSIEEFNIIDIISNGFKLSLETNNTIWKSEFNFKIILKKYN